MRRPQGQAVRFRAVQTSVSKIADARVRIAATVEAAELGKRVDGAARGLAGDLNLPGFRKGKVPPQLVIQRIGREAVVEQALRDALPGWYERALLDADVRPIGDPELDVPEVPGPGEPLEFTIEVGVRPEAELGEYRGLEVGRAEPEVPDEEIDSRIDRMRESMASLVTVERAAVAGDTVVIDFTGEIDGKPFDGGAAADHLYEVGSGRLIDGFDEALEGSTAGQELTVDTSFPADYHAEHLAGQDASFAVAVKEVRERRMPELTDDFAAENTDFDTVEELRDDVRGHLTGAAEHRAEDMFREAAVDAAAANATLTVPDELVTARATEIWERVERTISAQGMDPNAYLQIQGRTREEMIDEAREEAEQGLRREAVLAAIAAAESIEVSEEEMIEALTPPDGQRGDNPRKALKRLRSEGREKLLAEDLRLRKAADLVVEAAEPIELGRAEAREKLWTPGDD